MNGTTIYMVAITVALLIVPPATSTQLAALFAPAIAGDDVRPRDRIAYLPAPPSPCEKDAGRIAGQTASDWTRQIHYSPTKARIGQYMVSTININRLPNGCTRVTWLSADEVLLNGRIPPGLLGPRVDRGILYWVFAGAPTQSGRWEVTVTFTCLQIYCDDASIPVVAPHATTSVVFEVERGQ